MNVTKMLRALPISRSVRISATALLLLQLLLSASANAEQGVLFVCLPGVNPNGQQLETLARIGRDALGDLCSDWRASTVPSALDRLCDPEVDNVIKTDALRRLVSDSAITIAAVLILWPRGAATSVTYATSDGERGQGVLDSTSFLEALSESGAGKIASYVRKSLRHKISPPDEPVTLPSPRQIKKPARQSEAGSSSLSTQLEVTVGPSYPVGEWRTAYKTAVGLGVYYGFPVSRKLEVGPQLTYSGCHAPFRNNGEVYFPWDVNMRLIGAGVSTRMIIAPVGRYAQLTAITDIALGYSWMEVKYPSGFGYADNAFGIVIAPGLGIRFLIAPRARVVLRAAYAFDRVWWGGPDESASNHNHVAIRAGISF